MKHNFRLKNLVALISFSSSTRLHAEGECWRCADRDAKEKRCRVSIKQNIKLFFVRLVVVYFLSRFPFAVTCTSMQSSRCKRDDFHETKLLSQGENHFETFHARRHNLLPFISRQRFTRKVHFHRQKRSDTTNVSMKKGREKKLTVHRTSLIFSLFFSQLDDILCRPIERFKIRA